MLFAKTGRRIPKPRSVQLFGEPIQWVEIYRSGKKESGTEAGSAGTSPEQEKQSLHHEWYSAI
jgi:hypothetical protein